MWPGAVANPRRVQEARPEPDPERKTVLQVSANCFMGLTNEHEKAAVQSLSLIHI